MAFARAFAAEHVDELADRAAKLEPNTLIGADIGRQGGRRESQGTEKTDNRQGHTTHGNSSGGNVLEGSLKFKV